MRQFRKGDRRMITEAHGRQSLDALRKAILQDVDVKTGIEQKLRSARCRFGYESKRLLRPPFEWRSAPVGLPPP
jgi:hypothetical protein